MLLKIVLLSMLVPVILAAGRVFDGNLDCPRITHAGQRAACHCSEYELECEQRNLYEFPKFSLSAWPFKAIRLGKNTITDIPENAFQNINVEEIYLNDNLIHTVHKNAFKSLQANVTTVDLRNNNLTSLPGALADIHYLRVLDVRDNPIQADQYNDTIMKELGDYLTEFRFGYAGIEQWPSTVHHFQKLGTLFFKGGTMDQIPTSAFKGFEWTLNNLYIQNTNLISVPIALQELKNVVKFHFDNNLRVGDAGILIPAFAGITNKLETLSLQNDSLSTVPSLLLTLPVLYNLSLAHNNLQYLSDQAITNVISDLKTLNLQACNLDRIPGALSRLEHINNLDFAYNNITTVEKNDLEHLRNLASLNLSFNPLEYVSSQSFSDLGNLTELIMQETYLYQVPEALKNLPKIRTLDLRSKYPNIECNCDLGWLYCEIKRVSTIAILGECETITMGIQTYANNKIPQVCPVNCP